MAQLAQQQAGLRKQMRGPGRQARAGRTEAAARAAGPRAEETGGGSRPAGPAAGAIAGRAGRAQHVGRGRQDEPGRRGGARGRRAGRRASKPSRPKKIWKKRSRQLAERRRQAEEDLAHEQMARLEDSLKSLHERQKKLIQDTERLENLRAAAGRFTRAQLSTVNDLARQQKSLEGETSLLAEKLALTEVINLALDGAAKQMTRAAELLEHRETGSADAKQPRRRRGCGLRSC